VTASCSLFSQILKLILRTDFERIVKETGAEYCSKNLSGKLKGSDTFISSV